MRSGWNIVKLWVVSESVRQFALIPLFLLFLQASWLPPSGQSRRTAWFDKTTPKKRQASRRRTVADYVLFPARCATWLGRLLASESLHVFNVSFWDGCQFLSFLCSHRISDDAFFGFISARPGCELSGASPSVGCISIVPIRRHVVRSGTISLGRQLSGAISWELA